MSEYNKKKTIILFYDLTKERKQHYFNFKHDCNGWLFSPFLLDFISIRFHFLFGTIEFHLTIRIICFLKRTA